MSGQTILICEDEPTLRELMRLSLDPSYEFAEATDVAESIELARQLRPDIVLLDVLMPGGSGLTVLEHLRADPDLAATPVVIVSAFAEESDRVAAQDAGASGFLGKPFDPDDLEQLVEGLLASRR